MVKRVILGGLLVAAFSGAATLNVSGIVSFGDSLTDAGNDYIATGGATPAAPNYGGGEFTDGANSNPSTTGPQGVWVQQLATKLGVTVPLPSLAGGTDFAYGDSQTLTNAGPGNLVPSLNNEVLQALAANHNVLPSTDLYTFWSGANDIANNAASPTVAVQSADDIFNQILKVAAAGGKDFLWLDLPPLGDTPDAAQLGPIAQFVANQQTNAFNGEFAVDVQKLQSDGINVIPVDVNSLFSQIETDVRGGCTPGPADPYCFANITDPAQGRSVDPNSYLFWDLDHPTTAGHALIADAAYDAIEAAGSSAVPEPTPFVLAGAGLLLLGFARRRQVV